MVYSQEVENMCPVAQGVHHGAAPIPEEAKWVQAKEVKDISGFTHGIFSDTFFILSYRAAPASFSPRGLCSRTL